MDSLLLTILVSGAAFLIFFCFQMKFFFDTRRHRNIFTSFFNKTGEYDYRMCGDERDPYPQICLVGKQDSDLNSLITEINSYLEKTKGTSDYEFVRNKVERKLNMRYDQSTVHLAFPTYLGLMGTFSGVFLGILMFLAGFDDVDGITDESIKNLLIGVLVSMSTSLVGLFLTTINTGLAGEARKKIEDDKNEFYDFIQVYITKTASASLVSAISKLHDTVDKFEPAFSSVIEGFKEAFNECTRAFGDDFKQNVGAVTDAVKVMGANMEKINANIQLQERLLNTLKSDEIVRGMDKYVEAANHFVSITLSLNKFEEARRMMLAAAQEAIALQNQYNESLKVPREVAVRVNQILDRIKDFEDSVNQIGGKLNQREILGNDVVEAIGNQIKGIARKGKIADKYLEMADGKLEDLFTRQTAVIETMNSRYKEAIEGHIEGFEKMLKKQTDELEARHKEFMEALEERFNVEDVRQEFTNLRKLESLGAIEKKLGDLASSSISSDDVHKEIATLQRTIQDLKGELSDINKNTKGGIGGFSLFGSRGNERK